jgi:hypothetical protein
MKNLKIGNEYNYYDDGKIKPSRHSVVIIKDIIPFDKWNCSNEIRDLWEEDVKTCDFLYAPTTDYIIEAFYKNDVNNILYFTRTINNGWFSLGFLDSGRLDNNNLYTEDLIKNKKYFDEDAFDNIEFANFKPLK